MRTNTQNTRSCYLAQKEACRRHKTRAAGAQTGPQQLGCERILEHPMHPMHAFFPHLCSHVYVLALARSKKERAHTLSAGCFARASLKARHKTRWMTGVLRAGTGVARRSPLNPLSMADCMLLMQMDSDNLAPLRMNNILLYLQAIACLQSQISIDDLVDYFSFAMVHISAVIIPSFVLYQSFRL